MKLKQLALGTALLVTSGIASALPIGVTQIGITDNGLNGSGWFSSVGLNWTTSEFADFNFDLNGTATQAYGSFSTRDFGLGLADLVDTDPLNVSMFLTPPGSSVSSHGIVDAMADIHWFSVSNQRIEIDFTDQWYDMGSYEVSFQDLTITGNGTYNLLADFREIANVSSVPEPSILALLGLGMLGMGAASRRNKKA